jgi:biotin synthase
MEGQALCFLAGANSIFAGDKLLTTPNPEFNEDKEMFKILGLSPKEAFADKNKTALV